MNDNACLVRTIRTAIRHEHTCTETRKLQRTKAQVSIASNCACHGNQKLTMKNTVYKGDGNHKMLSSHHFLTYQSNIVLVPGKLELRHQSIELSISYKKC